MQCDLQSAQQVSAVQGEWDEKNILCRCSGWTVPCVGGPSQLLSSAGRLPKCRFGHLLLETMPFVLQCGVILILFCLMRILRDAELQKCQCGRHCDSQHCSTETWSVSKVQGFDAKKMQCWILNMKNKLKENGPLMLPNCCDKGYSIME